MMPAGCVCTTAILLSWTSVSHFVAFIPTVVGLLLPFVLVSVIGWYDNEFSRLRNWERAIYCILSILWLTFISFFLVYPLALDGTIPNSTSADWAIAMIPMFIVVFAFIIVLPCAIYVVGMKETYHDTVARVGICCLWPCMFGVSAVIIICLIGLVMKPGGDWDLMPYAGYAGTIFGCAVCGIAMMLCIVALAD